jgi:hypothetical protein
LAAELRIVAEREGRRPGPGMDVGKPGAAVVPCWATSAAACTATVKGVADGSAYHPVTLTERRWLCIEDCQG